MRDQADRYRRLGATTTSIERHDSALVATFGGDLDEQLLQRTVAVENDCCPFFGFDYQPSAQRLVITVQHADERPALEALQYALSSGRAGPSPGSSR